jgi:hypothetical protein
MEPESLLLWLQELWFHYITMPHAIHQIYCTPGVHLKKFRYVSEQFLCTILFQSWLTVATDIQFCAS